MGKNLLPEKLVSCLCEAEGCRFKFKKNEGVTANEKKTILGSVMLKRKNPAKFELLLTAFNKL